ncbi:hypothetical protein BDU57DRAFT_541622 [Ampelomyces quisqualis]|uniref:Uncharacterized protein n=1 Tax=Ampelomyces quisqualis TaxID=50730 RepID=A0A6A5QBE5_AMPQU|nr:hypothetical protein BDU57DRAFT_541622 [Ampelomyces quisqualis]
MGEHSVSHKAEGSHLEEANERRSDLFFAGTAEMVTNTGPVNEPRPRPRPQELPSLALHNNVPPQQQQHHLSTNGSFGKAPAANLTQYPQTGLPVLNNMAQSGAYSTTLGLATAPKQNKTQAAATQRPKPGARPKFLTDQLDYPYVMPPGPQINFTMADILVIVPGWAKNKSIISRFINNGLTAAVHIAIQQEHRNIDESEDVRRLRELTTDQYRRTMRQDDPAWTRARHRVPNTWNWKFLAVNNFIPDQARDVKFTAPEPIAFAAMTRHIKILPQGADAGDLTRALDFAMKSVKSDIIGEAGEWMFPDDIHAILKHIGYTTITDDHTDRAIFARYQRSVIIAASLDRSKRGYEQTSDQLKASAPKRQHIAAPMAPEHQFLGPRSAEPLKFPSWQASHINATMVPRIQPQVTLAPKTTETSDLAPNLGYGGSQHSQFWPGELPNSNTLPPLQPEATQTGFSTYPAYHSHTLPKAAMQGSPPKPLEHQLTRAGTFMQGPSVTLVPYSNSEDLLAPSEEPSIVRDSTSDDASAPSEERTITPPSLQLLQDAHSPNMVFAQPTEDGFPALPKLLFLDFDTALASLTPQLIDLTGDDVPAMTPEEVDAMMAAHQQYTSTDFMMPSPEGGLFPDTNMDAYQATTYDQRTKYPASKLLRECEEADDLEDVSDLAHAARWCRDPANLSGYYVVGEMDFVMSLQGINVG